MFIEPGFVIRVRLLPDASEDDQIVPDRASLLHRARTLIVEDFSIERSAVGVEPSRDTSLEVSGVGVAVQDEASIREGAFLHSRVGLS